MAQNTAWQDERALVRACLKGDPQATQRLVARFQRDVYAVCLRLLGHVHDAEDVTQEVFLRVFRSLHCWDKSRPLRPWILAIAVNRCRTWLRQRSWNSSLHDGLHDRQVRPDPNELWELQETLQEALGQLREEYRLVFVLYHDRHLPYEEIAEILGRPVGTIKTWLHRARLELIDYLRQRGWSEGLPTHVPSLSTLDSADS
ncbi:MAG: RNA polymerase sigma factor [Gemmatales bacterium]|nr:RNA polymerase sigma factor [Gemmatales bacterium]MDW7993816.1 RNA polymerase sigma factor [Gemmatales bacterium]